LDPEGTILDPLWPVNFFGTGDSFHLGIEVGVKFTSVRGEIILDHALVAIEMTDRDVLDLVDVAGILGVILKRVTLLQELCQPRHSLSSRLGGRCDQLQVSLLSHRLVELAPELSSHDWVDPKAGSRFEGLNEADEELGVLTGGLTVELVEKHLKRALLVLFTDQVAHAVDKGVEVPVRKHGREFHSALLRPFVRIISIGVRG